MSRVTTTTHVGEAKPARAAEAAARRRCRLPSREWSAPAPRPGSGRRREGAHCPVLLGKERALLAATAAAAGAPPADLRNGSAAAALPFAFALAPDPASALPGSRSPNPTMRSSGPCAHLHGHLHCGHPGAVGHQERRPPAVHAERVLLPGQHHGRILVRRLQRLLASRLERDLLGCHSRGCLCGVWHDRRSGGVQCRDPVPPCLLLHVPGGRAQPTRQRPVRQDLRRYCCPGLHLRPGCHACHR